MLKLMRRGPLLQEPSFRIGIHFSMEEYLYLILYIGIACLYFHRHLGLPKDFIIYEMFSKSSHLKLM